MGQKLLPVLSCSQARIQLTQCWGRQGPKLVSDEIVFHSGLSTRPARLPDRTMLTLKCRCMGDPIKITTCHWPSPASRPWELNTRSAVLPNMSKFAGLTPSNDWGGGAAEPVAWISGGDLNLGENTIRIGVNYTIDPTVANA